jgi:hydroxymethylglutaryl-CoA synthase
MKTGIESLAFYAPHYHLDLKTLASARGEKPGKYVNGLGQERMAVPAPDEDVVTMGANAARQALKNVDRSSIDTLMFATESGVDQSKAAAIYAHRLLELPTSCKAFELKQACCSSTAGLELSLALVAKNPRKKVLLIASDIARYGLGSAGEPTQGAGAIAMVISADPKVIAFEDASGSYTEDVMDFWRPNYLDEALVDGKYSIKIYLKALSESWKSFHRNSGLEFQDIDRFCYHLPFTRMAEKAHVHLAKINRQELTPELTEHQVEYSLAYNRVTGNCYTASLYEGLLSLLNECPDDLSGQRIGLFSYGSGCMATFFTGIVQPGYRKALEAATQKEMLEKRHSLTYEEYEDFYTHRLPTDGRDYQTGQHHTGEFRLAGLSNHKRVYEHCVQMPGETGLEKPETRKRYAAA